MAIDIWNDIHVRCSCNCGDCIDMRFFMTMMKIFVYRHQCFRILYETGRSLGYDLSTIKGRMVYVTRQRISTS